MSAEGSTHGKQMVGRLRSQPQIGIGAQVGELAKDALVSFTDFRAGYVVAADEHSVPDNSSPFCLDVDVDDQGRIVRMPGIEAKENLAPHDPQELAVHADLDGGNEVILFDSPSIGIKKTGVTQWYDVGLPSGDNWVACNHGGSLVFTNGSTSVYARSPGATTVTDLVWGPGRAIASFAGRLFLGGATIGGIANPLGMMWSGASGLVTDVNGYGAGYELLLADMLEGDWIVALRTMGFDLMPIILRKSIWVGRRTGDVLRPVDFAPRISTVGAVSEPTVRNTPYGVVMLSDDGVNLFDGNTIQHLSDAIDEELLPINYNRIRYYAAVYSPAKQAYKLFTPTGTWIYSFKYKRWLRSNAKIDRSVTIFNPATNVDSDLPAGWGIYWNGSWSEQITSAGSSSGIIGSAWLPASYSGGVWFGYYGSSQSVDLGRLNDEVMLSGTSLAQESTDVDSYLNAAQDPVWTTPHRTTEEFDQLYTYKIIEIEYVTQPEEECRIRLTLKNADGDFSKQIDVTLPPAATKKVKRVKMLYTGRGVGCRYEIISGSPQVSRFSIRVMPRGVEVA